ncbi:C40 family peptidase [Sphingobacterium bovistauri]|uniref:C40 family peptidase n=1 Tax=Sphingobacterium bovistauri TaxID=2781959 RepID=A0ABS7ZA97_9SPHI|nr:NlpC/P60 family protein [Sphingobacterium bovistauri]MCA5005624.1 C40 family peptidase [Sphingobacterium bovistauri]
MKRLVYLIFPLCTLLFLNSCGAKKKTAGSGGAKPTFENSNRGNKSNIKQYYATLLDSDPKELNESLYEFIDNWMGSPHRLGGLAKNGIDCSGFVGITFEEVYHRKLPRSSRDMANVVKRKYEDQLKEGDLVFFSFGGKAIDHVGIYLHNNKFVHVSTKQGVIISNLKDPWYYKYLTRCGAPEI